MHLRLLGLKLQQVCKVNAEGRDKPSSNLESIQNTFTQPPVMSAFQCLERDPWGDTLSLSRHTVSAGYPANRYDVGPILPRVVQDGIWVNPPMLLLWNPQAHNSARDPFSGRTTRTENLHQPPRNEYAPETAGYEVAPSLQTHG